MSIVKSSDPLPAGLTNQDPDFQVENAAKRKLRSVLFYGLCVVIALVSVGVLALLLVSIGYQGHSRLTTDLLTNPHSELKVNEAGMGPSIVGSLFICAICAATALPLGVGTAIFLEEFKPANQLLRILHGFVNLNISNLAGVPSIVYGLLGLSAFVFMFNIFGRIEVNEPSRFELLGVKHYIQASTLAGASTTVFVPLDDPSQKVRIDAPMMGEDANGNPIEILVWEGGVKPTDPEVLARTVRKGTSGGLYSERAWYYFRLPFGQSFLAAGLTLALVILPVIIIASQESLRGVPSSLREASLGLGATTWQATRYVTLPAALPGIMTGSILAMGRAIGEAAPILVVLGAVIAKNTGPQHLMDNVVSMPILIYNWAGQPRQEFQELAAGAIIVLLVVLLVLNSIAIILRQRLQRD